VVAFATLAVAIAIRLILPEVPPDAATGFKALVTTLQTPGLPRGLAGHSLVMLGNFAAFTYIRPALELTPGVDASATAALMATFGLGSVAGGLLTGALVDQHLAVLRCSSPVVLAASIALLAASPPLWLVVVAVVAWGAVFGSWLIIVSTWAGRVLPTHMEAGGGLVVAGYQFAIALGAGTGGILIDFAGVRATLVVAAVAALSGGVLFGTARRGQRPATAA